MRAKFLHFADCHLGFRQYDNKDRLYDFAKSFLGVVDRAVQEKVDFVLLAGDLFQKRAVDALTLNQAVVGLERLKAAGIPCIAVEGNHERAYYVDSIGWMEFLDQRGLITLLNVPFEDGKAVLKPYDKRRRTGAYIEPVAGMRVYGLRYYGAATAAAVAQIAEGLAETPADGVQYTAFMAHAGMEGVLDGASGGLSYRQWAVLRPHVDYLALGHVHKPFEAEGWIHNPGSLESCSIVESDWPERGFYLVTVDTDRAADDEPKHQAVLHRAKRRKVFRLSMKVDEHATPDLLCGECERYLQRKARDDGAALLDDQSRPLVELQLTGVLPFDRAGLDIERIRAAVIDAYRPLLPLVKDLTRSAAFAVEAQEGASRVDVERQVLRDLLARDQRYRDDAEKWTQVALSLKELALGGASPDAIVDELAHRMDDIAAHAAEQAPNADPIA